MIWLMQLSRKKMNVKTWECAYAIREIKQLTPKERSQLRSDPFAKPEVYLKYNVRRSKYVRLTALDGIALLFACTATQFCTFPFIFFVTI